MAELPSGTVTFLYTDIEGSTDLWERHPEEMQVALARHDTILESAIGRVGGVIFGRTGDGMVAVFASPRDTIAAAVTAQLGLKEEPWPKAVGNVRARMGLHTGEGTLVDGQYLNPPINRCARLMAIGHGGQVLVSAMTEPLVRGALPDDVGLADLGEHRLRDLSEPLRVFEVRHRALPAEFPPLRSLDAFPGNLPVQISSFIGRQVELDRVRRALQSARQVTLTGVGGVGKTRLALQVAAEVLPQFKDGAWLVELGAVRDPEGVQDAFAAVFGVTSRSGQSVGDALEDFLRAKELLVVVDNCEHLLDTVAGLVDALERTCHRIVILSTSREGLATEGERIVALPSLHSPEADSELEDILVSDSVALFVDRAQAVDAEFELSGENARSVAQVCARLDGVPLAIEIAAARVATMTPAELVRGLDHRFEILAGGRRRAVQRHQTLRAAIDWSYELCTDPERRLLARLSVFSGGAAREAIEAVCGGEPITPGHTFAALSSLVAKSLVVAQRAETRTRYRLLETIREYGEEQVAELGETQVLRAAHAEYFCALANSMSEELLGPRQIETARLFEAERENLLAAVHQALDSANVDLALRLMRNAPPVNHQLGTPTFLPDRAILSLPGASDHPLFAYCMAVNAVHCALRGEVAGVESACLEALAAARRAGAEDKLFVEILVSNARGVRSMASGAMADAAQCWERSIDLTRSAGMAIYLPGFLASAAFMHEMAGETDAAIARASESLELARRLGRSTLVVMNLAVLAAALVDRDPIRSRALLDEALQLRATHGFEGYADSSQITFTAARLGDWALVLLVAPLSIRALHWSVQRPALAGILNVVARALVGTDPETGGILQGAARRLIATPHHTEGPAERSNAPGGSVSERAAKPVSFVTEIRRETTALLKNSVGEERLRDLRASGELLDEEQAVECALDAVKRAS